MSTPCKPIDVSDDDDTTPIRCVDLDRLQRSSVPSRPSLISCPIPVLPAQPSLWSRLVAWWHQRPLATVPCSYEERRVVVAALRYREARLAWELDSGEGTSTREQLTAWAEADRELDHAIVALCVARGKP